MRPAVDTFDDGIGGPLQLVIKTTRHQAAEDGISGLVAMEGKAGDVGLVAGRRHGPMHSLDDVGAYLEVAKCLGCAPDVTAGHRHQVSWCSPWTRKSGWRRDP